MKDRGHAKFTLFNDIVAKRFELRVPHSRQQHVHGHQKRNRSTDADRVDERAGSDQIVLMGQSKKAADRPNHTMRVGSS